MADVHRSLASAGNQLYLLEKVAPWLPPLGDSQALHAVFAADYLIEDKRAEAIALLAEVLPPGGRAEAARWLAARSVRPSSRAEVLTTRITLEPGRGDELLEQAMSEIEALDEWERSDALAKLSLRLSGRHVSRAIALAAEIESSDHRFSALYALAPRCATADTARELLVQTRRFYDAKDGRSGAEGFGRRTRLTAVALVQIPKDEWAAEIASFMPDLQSKPTPLSVLGGCRWRIHNSVENSRKRTRRSCHSVRIRIPHRFSQVMSTRSRSRRGARFGSCPQPSSTGHAAVGV